MRQVHRDLVMDVGMYDGSDTAYYLEKGYRVIAVEAHPDAVARAGQRFSAEIGQGRLTILPVGIAERRCRQLLHVSQENPGSSSFDEKRVRHLRPGAPIEVDCMPFEEILDQYGVPFYLKVDIEGDDRLCLAALRCDGLPAFLSWEVGDDLEELIQLAMDLGYRRFKIINQLLFRELEYINSLRHRLRRRLRRTFGLDEFALTRRGGYGFAPNRSSGPMGEEAAGSWCTGPEIIRAWVQFCHRYATEDRGGWFDVHASVPIAPAGGQGAPGARSQAVGWPAGDLGCGLVEASAQSARA
jgi:FkbM family methyltransferase